MLKMFENFKRECKHVMRAIKRDLEDMSDTIEEARNEAANLVHQEIARPAQRAYRELKEKIARLIC